MTSRLWYPQLDIYDCVRRMSCLMFLTSEGMHRERLYILDFYLANTPLLHYTTMKLEVRAQFRSLKIPRPEKEFITYPAAQLLFHQMEPVQKDAISALSGKGLVSQEDLDRKVINLSKIGRSVFKNSISANVSKSEMKMAEFLVRVFGETDEGGMRNLRSSTGLRRAS